MGVSHSVEEFNRKLQKAAVKVGKDVEYAATEQAALLVKKHVLALTPGRLSGVGKSGAKLGVRYNIGKYEGRSKALVFATGPFHLIERNTRPHAIPKLAGSNTRTTGRKIRAKKGRLFGPAFGGLSRKALDKKPLKLGGSTYRAHVHHPGTKGKHPWERGVAIAAPKIPDLYQNALHLVLSEVF